MPGPSAFNRRFNSMPAKQGSVGASAKQLPPAAPAKKKAKRRPMPPPQLPPSGRVNPFATKRGSK
jgi:hypothetical protein